MLANGFPPIFSTSVSRMSLFSGDLRNRLLAASTIILGVILLVGCFATPTAKLELLAEPRGFFAYAKTIVSAPTALSIALSLLAFCAFNPSVPIDLAVL